MPQTSPTTQDARRARHPRLRVALHSLLALATVLLLIASPMFGATPDQDGKPDEVDRMVKDAVSYLLRAQQQDGAICDTYPRNSTAMTSLALMAMAGVGHLPTDPTPEGKAMQKALDFVLRDERQDSKGYFGGRDGSRMYGHGITTLMLSEFLGMGLNSKQDALIRQRLEKAVELTLSAQRVRGKQRNHAGGWRYEPDSQDSDLSVTVWQLMSLRSAKNAGLEVPDEAIEEAINYLKRSYQGSKSRDRNNPTGVFGYQVGAGNSETFSDNAMGLLSMQVCGQYGSPEVIGSANTLKSHAPNNKSPWLFYGLYYYSQGMYQYAEGLRLKGDKAAGDRWASDSFKLTMNILAGLQNRKGDPRSNAQHGSWLSPHGSERSAGLVYGTSMGVLALSVKYHYLPIYQR